MNTSEVKKRNHSNSVSSYVIATIIIAVVFFTCLIFLVVLWLRTKYAKSKEPQGPLDAMTPVLFVTKSRLCLRSFDGKNTSKTTSEFNIAICDIGVMSED
ncbi:hypothetical protein CBL_13670 [Carabus blaptoides fortunei]